MDACLGRLDGIVLIVNWRCRAGQVVDLIDLQIQREGDVVADGFEVRIREQMRNIGARAGEIIVDADDVRAFAQEALAKMRSEETCAARDQHAFLDVHSFRLSCWEFNSSSYE